MSEERGADERLRRGLLDLADPEGLDGGGRSGTEADREAIWAASGGELDPVSTRRLIDVAARSPEAADAFRVALALRREAAAGRALAPRRSWPWLAVAASAAVVALSLVAIREWRPGADRPPTLRQAEGYRVGSLVTTGATLPREAFVLRWSAGPPGTSYKIEVAGAELELLDSRSSLLEAEYVVPADALEQVERGATVFWRVEAFLPDGQRVASDTFRVEIGD